MFENVCSFPLPADLFAQAIHPTESVIAVGLATGHVQALRLPDLEEEESEAESQGSGANGSGSITNGAKRGARHEAERRSSLTSSEGRNPRLIESVWRTRRHKGSCRSLAFDADGARLVSAGTDGIVKLASSATGQVEQKAAVPAERGEAVGQPALLHAVSADTLVLATDGGAVHLYDIRAPLAKGAAQTHRPHDDYVSSLTALRPQGQGTVVRQWVTTGGTTLAVTDARRGVLVKSEDQEDELLSSALVQGLSSRGSNVGEKVVVGGAGGVLTLWERGIWDDQDERIVIDPGSRRAPGESLDVLAAAPPHVGTGREVLVGMGDGRVHVVRVGLNKVVAEFRHDDVEGVVALGFDHAGRAISGGGTTLKVWQEWHGDAALQAKRDRSDSGSDSDDSDDSADDSDDDDRPQGKRRKKRRKGKAGGGGASAPRLGAFDGLD